MHINSFNNFSPEKLPRKNFNENKLSNFLQNDEKTSKNVDLQSHSPAEALGRSIVSFRGIPELNDKLNKPDENFADCLGQIFRLDDAQLKNVKAIIKDFLKENDFNRLSDMYSDDIFEFANEQACLTERLCNELNLTDFESSTLCFLTTLQVNEGDISRLCNRKGQTLVETNKYVRDFSPISNVLEKHGVNDFDVFNNVYNYFSSLAADCNKNTIFEMFLPNNSVISMENMEILSKPEYGGFDDSEIADILIDFVKLSDKSIDERLDGVNRKKESEKFDDSVVTVIIADEIAEKYEIEISEKLLELIDLRKTKNNKDGRSLVEVAYRIAEEYNLDAKSVDEIMKIIEKNENKTNKEKFSGLIDVFSKESN